MAEIVVYNKNTRVAKTSYASDLVEKKDLMKDWYITFNVTNIDSAAPYIADENAVYESEGQQFDVVLCDKNSGENNTIAVTANHVSCQANNYVIPANYAFTGTVHDIITDMLEKSGANVKFSVGTCADISGSIDFKNTQEISLRKALFGLTTIGVEIDFDNFIINAPVRIGVDVGKTFKFGRDLKNINIHFDKSTNPITRSTSILIADLQQISGYSPGDVFGLGDTIKAQYEIAGNQIIEQRICTYERHFNDPAQNAITIGQYVSDLFDTISAMQISINNTVQQGKLYNNVSISDENGIICVRSDNKVVVKFDAIDVFKLLKEGVMTGGVDEDGFFMASSFGMPGVPEFKMIAGKGPNSTDGRGVFLIKNATTTKDVFAKIYSIQGNGAAIDLIQNTRIFGRDDTTYFARWFTSEDNDYGALHISPEYTQIIRQFSESKYSEFVLPEDEASIYINGYPYFKCTPTETDIETPLYVQGIHVTSDRNLKENISEAQESVLNEIKALKFYYFTYKNPGADQSMNYGFMADEVPFQMTSNHKTINALGAAALSLKGVQEIITLFEDYKTETETRLKELEAKVFGNTINN